MKLPGFIPAELRELASFVPASGWDAVEWRPLLSAMRAMSVQMVTGRGVSRLSQTVDDAIDSVTLVRNLEAGEVLDRTTPTSRRLRG